MKAATTISTTALLAGLFSAQSAFADLTAEETWATIQSLGAQYGEQITGTLKRDGDSLIIENAAFTYDMPEVSVTGSIGDLVLTEQGDGSVALATPGEMPIQIAVTSAEGETFEVSAILRQSGLSAIYTGSPEALTTEYAADEVSFEIVELEVEDVDDLDFDMMFTLGALSGTTSYTLGEIVEIKNVLSAGTFSGVIKGADPEGSGSVDITAVVSDIASSSATKLPAGSEGINMSNLAAMMADGYEGSGAGSAGPLDIDIKFDGPEGSGVFELDFDGLEGDFDMQDVVVDYDVTYKGMVAAFSGSQIPFPKVTVKTDENAMALTMPLGATDDARDLRLMTTIRGLTVDDFLWGMFDPTGILPRDPANLMIDLSGSARWLINIFDPEVAESLQGMPGEIYALDADVLELDVAGARLTGNGSFDFDNTDLVTFNGMPAPEGTLNLKLVGGNALLDKLVELGLLPADQAMGVRMMSGVFARPGDGDDTLISEINVQKDGSVLVNGQRLK